MNNKNTPEEIKTFNHVANGLIEAIELGTAELRKFYGDNKLVVKASVKGNKVKIESIDTDHQFNTVWTFEIK